jgi:hypothetical protein
LKAWITRWVRPLRWGIFAVIVLALAYGSIRYPDAPLKRCETPYGYYYCGRYGAIHTAEEYQAFIVWETTFKIVGCAAFISFLVLTLGFAAPKRRETNRNSS